MTTAIKLYLYLGAAACIAIVIGLIYAKGSHDRGATDKVETLTAENAGLGASIKVKDNVFDAVGARLDQMVIEAGLRSAREGGRDATLIAVQEEIERHAETDYCGARAGDIELWNGLLRPAPDPAGATAAQRLPDH
jgi:hypothetical protein